MQSRVNSKQGFPPVKKREPFNHRLMLHPAMGCRLRDGAKRKGRNMPKETITGDRIQRMTPVEATKDGPAGTRVEPYEGGSIEPGEYLEYEPSLAIHWERDSHIQLSITIDAKAAVRIGEEAKRVLNGTLTLEQMSVYSVPLERAEVQALIRHIRRARDQVFEADE